MKQALQNGLHLAGCVKEDVLFQEVACLPQRWFRDLPRAALPLRITHCGTVAGVVTVVVVGAGSVLQCTGQHSTGHDVPCVRHQGFVRFTVADGGWPDVAHEELDVVVLIDVKHQVKDPHSHLGAMLPGGQKPMIGGGGQELEGEPAFVVQGVHLETRHKQQPA